MLRTYVRTYHSYTTEVFKPAKANRSDPWVFCRITSSYNAAAPPVPFCYHCYLLDASIGYIYACTKRAFSRNRRCLGAGEACSYSKRRPRLRAAQYRAAAGGPKVSGGRASGQGIYGPATLPAGCDENNHASATLPARPGESTALQQYGSMSLKRFVNKL